MKSSSATVVPSRIISLRQRLNWSQKDLADRIGVSQQSINSIEAGLVARPKKLRELAAALRASQEYLLGQTDIIEEEPRERMAPILGLAGAGPDGTVLFAEGQATFGEAPAPPGAGEHVAALEVRGDSMYGLANDGWLLFYEEKTEPRDEYMGEPCVCWLENGHVLVKVPEPTLVPGLFNLTSTNASTMRSVAVREMALVTGIVPRRAARRYVRRNPNHAVVDVHNGPRPESRK